MTRAEEKILYKKKKNKIENKKREKMGDEDFARPTLARNLSLLIFHRSLSAIRVAKLVATMRNLFIFYLLHTRLPQPPASWPAERRSPISLTRAAEPLLSPAIGPLIGLLPIYPLRIYACRSNHTTARTLETFELISIFTPLTLNVPFWDISN